MEKVILKAEIREATGKSGCKHLRKEGLIPAVVYKDGKKGLSVKVDNKDLWHALHTEAGENAIITMEIDSEGKEVKKTVIVKEMQNDPLNDKFLHVDFHEISLKEKLKVKVPVIVKGEPVGVKEEDGVLSQLMWEVEVECLPTDIPEHVDINVDELKIGDSVHIKDLAPIPGVTILDDPEQAIAGVHPPKAEEEEVVEEAVEGEEVEPEVIKKGKAEEEEEGEAPEEEAPQKAEEEKKEG